MKLYLKLLLAFTVLFSVCLFLRDNNISAKDSEIKIDKNEKEFLKNLASLCGKSFRGKQIFMDPRGTSWADNDLIMHVTICEDNMVHIPFHVDDNKSRTWIFAFEDGKLRFRHDHRHEDGTPEDLTLYGGYTDGTGTAFIQIFPNDEYTKNLVSDDIERTWVVILDENFSTLTYKLRYHGERYFEARFDLTKPL